MVVPSLIVKVLVEPPAMPATKLVLFILVRPLVEASYIKIKSFVPSTAPSSVGCEVIAVLSNAVVKVTLLPPLKV